MRASSANPSSYILYCGWDSHIKIIGHVISPKIPNHWIQGQFNYKTHDFSPQKNLLILIVVNYFLFIQISIHGCVSKFLIKNYFFNDQSLL